MKPNRAPRPAPPPAPRAAYYGLAVLTVVYSVNFIDRQLLAILQEPIKAELGLSDGQLGLLTGFAFALFYVSAGIPIARWADRANRRNIVALALALWSGMTALCGLAQNYLQLLLARIGVGVGEAGGSPPSHSIISDLFPPERRATALGFYSTGTSIGILFGFLFGGWLNEYFGWRMAFLVVGLPGVLLALIVRFTLAEPPRGGTETRIPAPRAPADDPRAAEHNGAAAPTRAAAGDEPPASFIDALAVLWASRAFRHIALGAGLNAFVGYSANSWHASYMIRSHGMAGTGELGTWLALIYGLGGAIGVFGGGYLADRLAPRDLRWHVWLPALAGFIALPFLAGVYLVKAPYAALAMMAVPGMLANVYLGNAIALSHGIAGARMRAMASATLFFILNIVGLGAGPWAVGALSDWLHPAYGAESLRYAMLYALPPVAAWSALHFLLAARPLRGDLAAAPP